MRGVVAVFILFLMCSPALAYERPEAISLAGEWEYCPVEPMIDIVADRYVRPDFPTLCPEWDEVIDPAASPPWDSEWHSVQVPLAWEYYTNAGYNEAGWYARHFDVPPEWVEDGGRIWLEFDAVATAAGVWADGQFVGAHVGDYSRWRVELTDTVTRKYREALSSGRAGFDVVSPYTVLIAVYVDELPHHITQGFLSMIAPHHGGIWQDVRVYSTGALAIEPDGLHIEAQHVPMDDEFNCEYTCSIDVEDTAEHGPLWADVLIELPEPFEPGGHMSSEYFIDLQPMPQYIAPGGLTMWYEFNGVEWLEPWSPETPAVYRMTVTLLEEDPATGERVAHDTVSQTFAMRDIEIAGSEVLLNGEPIYIRSALNWGCYPGVFGPAPPPSVVREEFDYIRRLGFNAETVCLVNMPDYYYDIADEMGVLIWQEYPTWHNTFIPEHEPTLQREFRDYFERDRNHPSIIMRSMSVEAGVQDQDVMAGLVGMAREMTDTPVQDNNSWFWLSNEELTDWYGEDNYLNNNQWLRHLLNTLPGQLDELPEKPYMIGESILNNSWVDVDALSEFISRGGAVSPPSNGDNSQGGDSAPPLQISSADVPSAIDGGRDASPTEHDSVIPGWSPPEGMLAYIGGPSDYPWWFPSCYASAVQVSADLRERYNPLLPDGLDIINDVLGPQSDYYNLGMRRFQMELMHADRRYRGYTVNVVRDMPLIRAGLLDSLGRERWPLADWLWHGDHTASPVTVEEWQAAEDKGELMGRLLSWDHAWDSEIDRTTPIVAVNEGYTNLHDLLADWPAVEYVANSTLGPATDMTREPLSSRVLVTSVLTPEAVWHMQNGGAVILLTSKWPGALGSHHHFFWRDAMFVPPFGPWNEDDSRRMIKVHPLDLNLDKAEVIPVDGLGLTDQVDPLLRLYDTHDLSTVVTYDQVFAARAGSGLFIASSLDHSTDAGQWVLGKLAAWASEWVNDPDFQLMDVDAKDTRYPQAALEPASLRELAVARANGILPLDEGWQFALDEDQQGEELGYQLPDFDANAWDTVRTGVSWEALGYSHNGMGWYRKRLDIPADWAGGRVRLIAEGIDDAYAVWVNGRKIATHGSFTVHEETVWLVQTVTDLTDYLVPGEENTIALQVVDITGQGGIYKPLYLAVE